jgi:hypothetical protein
VPRGKHYRHPKRNSGFSLFEMVVVICSIVILYMVAEERLNQMPAAAERANFIGVLQQIKTGVSFEMVTRLARGQSGEVRQLEGANPMDFLIEPPSNYRGELELVTDAVERRNSWYFETATGELVYVVGGASIDDVTVKLSGVEVHLGQIRLKLMNLYSQEEDETSVEGGSLVAQEAAGGNWEALILAPVNEYTWERSPEEPIPVQ